MIEHKHIANGNRLQLEKLAFDYNKSPNNPIQKPKRKTRVFKTTILQGQSLNRPKKPPLKNKNQSFFLEDILDIFMKKKEEPNPELIKPEKVILTPLSDQNGSFSNKLTTTLSTL